MVLSCPHCHTNTAFGRGDFFGSWVVCKQCEWPFAWRKESEAVRSGEIRTADAPAPVSSAAAPSDEHGKSH
jgi:hypothetical protein